MNKISFNCQQCGKLIEKSIRNAGMQMRCPDCAAKITIPAQAPADELVNTSPEIQDTIPLAVPQAAPQGTLSATPSVTPSAIPVATPQAVPPVTPSVTPKATPQVVPAAVPAATPKVTPKVTPKATPQVVPAAVPAATPKVTPKVAPAVAAPNQTVDFQQQPEKSSNPISKKVIKKLGYAIITIGTSVLLIAGAYYGYDYYTRTYLPRKDRQETEAMIAQANQFHAQERIDFLKNAITPKSSELRKTAAEELIRKTEEEIKLAELRKQQELQRQEEERKQELQRQQAEKQKALFEKLKADNLQKFQQALKLNREENIFIFNKNPAFPSAQMILFLYDSDFTDKLLHFAELKLNKIKLNITLDLLIKMQQQVIKKLESYSNNKILLGGYIKRSTWYWLSGKKITFDLKVPKSMTIPTVNKNFVVLKNGEFYNEKYSHLFLCEWAESIASSN